MIGARRATQLLLIGAATYNQTAKPFAWTYDGRPLKAA
jgi:hypothetical protein